MKASKGNKVYTISEAQKASFLSQGYDITDDEGTVLEYGRKTVSYEEYAKLKKENLELKNEIELLKSEPPVENEGKSKAKK